MKRCIVPLLAILALAACNKGTPNYTPQPLSFAGQPPIRLSVAEIRVVDGYEAPLIAPNVDHEFPTPPEKAVNQWVHERMKAVGSTGILEVTIEDAAVKEVRLPKKTGIEGWFTDQQDARFDANLRVSMRLYADSTGLSNADAQVTVTRSQTINEKASVADRERVFDAMARDIMTGFDSETQIQLARYFTPYLAH